MSVPVKLDLDGSGEAQPAEVGPELDENEWWVSGNCALRWEDVTKSYCNCSEDKATKCLVRAMLDCPHEDPLHYDDDGCPSCHFEHLNKKSAEGA